jgi:hypothetical protein
MAAGARVALRTLAPVAAGVVAASVMYGSPTLVVGIVKALLFPPAAGLAPAILTTALAMTVATASAPRLILGLAGWLRSLPAPALLHRRAVTAGLMVVQLPVLVLVLAGGLLASVADPVAAAPRLVALAPMAWASSLASLALARRWARTAAAAASVLAWIGTWTTLVAAVVLVIAVDAAAGPLRLRTGGRADRRWSAALPIGPKRRSAILFWMVVGWRALGRRILGGWLSAVIVIAPATLFLENNSLARAHEVAAVRLAGVFAIVLVVAAIADSLVRRRPPWPWIRSMPWSATHRIALDASLLGAIALPVVAATAGLETSAVIPVLMTLPFVAFRGAAAIRAAPGRASGAAGVLLAEGLLVAGMVTLVVWTSVAFLALTPLAVWLAAERERRQDVSRWHELHHVAAGDSVSWSDA